MIEFFNLKVENFQDLLISILEKDNKLIYNLLKPIAYILESRGSIFDAFYLNYISCILEQNLVFDPSKRGYIDSYFPLYKESTVHFKAYAPAYLNLLRMNEEYSDSIFSSTVFKEDETELISHSLRRIDPPERMDNYVKSIPILIKNLLLITKFFQLDSDINKTMELIEKNRPINATKKREVRTSGDTSKEEKRILNEISKNFKVFNKSIGKLDFLAAPFIIDKFLENLDRTYVSIITPQKNFFQDQLSEIMNIQMRYGIDNFPELADYSIRNYLSPNMALYGLDMKNREFDLNQFNLYNIQRDLIIKQKSDFELIERIFTNKIDTNGYPFKLVFNRRYKLPKHEDISFWRDLFKELDNDVNQLIELLDLFMFNSRFFISFSDLEKLALILLNKYDIENAVNYLNTFHSYLIWFNERLKNPRTYIIPYTRDQDSIFLIFDFCFNVIKAKLYWEYRERSIAKDYINQADKILKMIEKKPHKLFDIKIYYKYNEDLNNLKTSLLM